MKLIATRAFTDKRGQQRQANQSFEVRDEEEAQDIIRQGNAREAEDPSQTSSSSGSRQETR